PATGRRLPCGQPTAQACQGGTIGRGRIAACIPGFAIQCRHKSLLERGMDCLVRIIFQCYAVNRLVLPLLVSYAYHYDPTALEYPARFPRRRRTPESARGRRCAAPDAQRRQPADTCAGRTGGLLPLRARRPKPRCSLSTRSCWLPASTSEQHTTVLQASDTIICFI